MSTSTSWSSGTWVLSNNLLFPPTKDGSLLSPGSKQWTMATVGDSGADLFYACLSAGIEAISRKLLFFFNVY